MASRAAGRVLRRSLRAGVITTDELMTQLREQGAGSVGEVGRCYVEGGGRISVIRKGAGGGGSKSKKKASVR